MITPIEIKPKWRQWRPHDDNGYTEDGDPVWPQSPPWCSIGGPNNEMRCLLCESTAPSPTGTINAFLGQLAAFGVDHIWCLDQRDEQAQSVADKLSSALSKGSIINDGGESRQ